MVHTVRVVLLTFSGEGRNALHMAYKLSTLESLLDHTTGVPEVELTLSVFHLILFGEIIKMAFKQQVIFTEQSMNCGKAFNHLKTKDCITTMFLVLCVTLPLRTLNSCYQQKTFVPVDGAGHTMDISWQNDIIMQEGTHTFVLTTRQKEQLEVLQVTTSLRFTLLRLDVDHFLVLPTLTVESLPALCVSSDKKQERFDIKHNHNTTKE